MRVPWLGTSPDCLLYDPTESKPYDFGEVKCPFSKKEMTIAVMRVFPNAIVLTTKSHFHVKRTYTSIRGLVVRTITLGKTRISVIEHACDDQTFFFDKKSKPTLKKNIIIIFFTKYKV